jgi:iron complex outermembrane recepter protein
MKTVCNFLLRLSTSLLLVPASTLAQTSDPAPTQVQALEEVLVTATRRSASLQTVPQTITAISSDTLDALDIKTVVDLPQLVSGLTVNRQGAAANSFMRGVGSNSQGFTTESPVAVYVDGFYLPYSSAVAFSFNNIERVEVLKGPQGTLYGRNATGGLINVITRDPGAQVHVDASASYDNYDAATLNFYGSAPLSETLAANLAVTHTNQGDSWGRNLVTGTNNMKLEETGLDGKLRWIPTSSTSVTLHGLFDHVKTDQGAVLSIYPGSVGVDGTRYLGEYRNASRVDSAAEVETFHIGAKIDHDFGFASFLSLTGYLHTRADISGNNSSGIPGNPVAGQAATIADLSSTSKTISQELQLRSNPSATSRLEWIVGAYYFDDDNAIRAASYGTCVGNVCVATPVPTVTNSNPTTKSYAGYGEGTYKLADRTRLTFGLRYTDDHRGLTGLAEPLPGRPNSPTVLPASTVLRPGDPYTGNPSGIPTSISFSKLTYKAVLAQDLNENVHTYASYNRGFRSGGYSASSFVNMPTRPEVLDSYEIGIKSELFNRLLRLNVAGFQYSYKDIQLRTSAPPAPPGQIITYNAAAARIKGIDVDFNFVPTTQLSINGSFEYLDGKYTKFPNTNCTAPRVIGGAILGGNVTLACDNSGRRVINSPEISFTFGAVYNIESKVGSFALAANDKYTSKFYWDPANRLAQPAYHLLNASLTWTAPSTHYDVQLFAKNVNSKYYAVYAAEGTSDTYLPGAPRTYGLTVGFRY